MTLILPDKLEAYELPDHEIERALNAIKDFPKPIIKFDSIDFQKAVRKTNFLTAFLFFVKLMRNENRTRP